MKGSMYRQATFLSPEDSADEGKEVVLSALSDDGSAYIGACEGFQRVFDPSGLVLGVGTPVVCEGLLKSKHLNGKAAAFKGFDEKTGRHFIVFEDDQLGQAKVKGSNLRVVFFNQM